MRFKMDQKHIDYCIRLGNPYYIEKNQMQYNELENSSWDNFSKNENNVKFNLPNNSKKFTN